MKFSPLFFILNEKNTYKIKITQNHSRIEYPKKTAFWYFIRITLFRIYLNRHQLQFSKYQILLITHYYLLDITSNYILVTSDAYCLHKCFDELMSSLFINWWYTMHTRTKAVNAVRGKRPISCSEHLQTS